MTTKWQGNYLTSKFNCTPCTNPRPANSHYDAPGPPYSPATAAVVAAAGGNCSWGCDAGYFRQGGACPRVPDSTCQEDTVTLRAGLCSGVSFPVRSCAHNASDHAAIIKVAPAPFRIASTAQSGMPKPPPVSARLCVYSNSAVAGSPVTCLPLDQLCSAQDECK
jgi:hypothetical protein